MSVKAHLFTLTLLCLCLPVGAQQMSPTPQQLGSIYYAYPTPSYSSTPVPEGFTPVYISHYGRHASRWMTDDSRYLEVVQLFDSLASARQLTALGQDVRQRLHRVWEDARGRSGNITPLGERQQRDIAGRMVASCPTLFADSAVIDARSSTSLRCAISMSYFTERLKEFNPRLRVSRRAYGQYMEYIAHTSPQAEAFTADTASWRTALCAFESRMVRPQRLLSSLSLCADRFTPAQADALIRGLYWIAADMQNVELKGVSFYDLFTPDELMGLWRTVNARMYVCNAAAPQNGGLMPRQAIPLLRHILSDADAALCDGTAAAHLRFGHDTHLIRLLALMQVEGCAVQEADYDRFHLAWQDYRISPMSANLQIRFFRHSGGDVWVLLLLNEREATLPIPSVQGPYYRWTDVRAFWEKACQQ